VGDQDDRQPVLVEPLKDREDLAAGLCVERARRLIGEQHGGVVDERAGNGDALLLASRQLGGIVPHARSRQTERSQARLGSLTTFGCRHTRVDERHFDIGERRRAGKEVEVLEHEADLVPSDARQGIVIETADLVAVERVATGRWPVQTAEDVQERRLAGARRPHDSHELTALDRQGYAIQRGYASHTEAVIPMHVFDVDQRHRRSLQ
jgi:hypothetical protein